MNLKQAGVDYERMHYNTVVSAAMKMLNALEEAKSGNGSHPAVSPAVISEGVGILLRVLYPIAPHITHALWSELGYQSEHGEIIDTPWPQVDDSALVQDEMELVVQVNGKVRGSIRVPTHAEDAAITATALADANVIRFVEGRAGQVFEGGASEACDHRRLDPFDAPRAVDLLSCSYCC